MAGQLQATLIGACDTAIPKKKWYYSSVPWRTPELIRGKEKHLPGEKKISGGQGPRNEGAGEAAV